VILMSVAVATAVSCKLTLGSSVAVRRGIVYWSLTSMFVTTL